MEPKTRDLYNNFRKMTIAQLQQLMLDASTREEKAFYRTLLNMKLVIEQEKIVGEALL